MFGNRFAVLPVILLGMAIRTYHCHDRAMYLDEATTWRAGKFSWLGTISAAAGDNHPPLYFLGSKLWMTIFGDSLLAMRSASILASGLAMWAMYLFTIELQRSAILGASASVDAERPAALFTVALLAVSPFHAYVASEARMYMLGGALLALSSLALLRALDDPRGMRAWVPFIAASTAAVYTHYYLLFSLAAHAVFLVLLLVWRKEARAKRGLVAVVCVVALFGPWVSALRRQIAQVDMAWWMKPFTAADGWNLWAGLFRASVSVPPEGLVRGGYLYATGLVMAALLVSLMLARRWAGVLLAVSIAFPWLCGMGLSLFGPQNVLRGKYLFFAQLFVFPAAALLTFMLPTRWIRWPVAGALVAHALYAVVYFHTVVMVADRPDIPAALQYVESRRAGAAVVIRPFEYLSARYYAKDPRNWYVYAEDGRIKHFEGRAFLMESDAQVSDAQLASLPDARAFVVDSELLGVRVPAHWHLVERRFFERAESVKGLEIRVTEYTVDLAAR